MLNSLRSEFPDFVRKVNASARAKPEQILPAVTEEQLEKIEKQLKGKLPTSYRKFLQLCGGFTLYGGPVQFLRGHPFRHEFPPLSQLTKVQLQTVRLKGGRWPPPSQGMICFAEYFLEADGDQVLFDDRGALQDGEYPVVYYCHDGPSIEKVGESFRDWLENRCIDEMAV